MGLRAHLPLGWQEAEKCDYPLKGSMLSLGKGGGHMPTARLISKQALP